MSTSSSSTAVAAGKPSPYIPATHPHQFTLFAHASGINPWKVSIILDELGLSYHSIYLSMMSGEQKSAPYTDITPNGRMPALIDHWNDDYTIWESGAIVLYLVERYDKERKISFEGEKEKGWAVQWVMFQMSGQGPYYGQAVWFWRYHPGDKIESAVSRYINEIHRVLSVLEKELTDNNKEWLVGDRVSYADLIFVTWHWILDPYLEQLKGWREKYPRVGEWDRRMNEMRSVKKNKEEWERVKVSVKQ